MRTKQLAIAACALAYAAVAAGCGSSPDGAPAASAPVFVGLDRTVVEEVLANPDARRKIEEEEPGSARDSMAQGIVINFITCREVAAAYRSWVTTGVRPELAAVPEVRSPQEPSYTDARGIRAHLQARIATGDPAQVRAHLEGVSSCGHWIPAAPGDVSGPTIEDALKEIG